MILLRLRLIWNCSGGSTVVLGGGMAVRRRWLLHLLVLLLHLLMLLLHLRLDLPFVGWRVGVLHLRLLHLLLRLRMMMTAAVVGVVVRRRRVFPLLLRLRVVVPGRRRLGPMSMPVPVSLLPLNLNLPLPESVILLLVLLLLVVLLLLDGVGLERRGKVRHPLHPLSDTSINTDPSTEAGGVRVQDDAAVTAAAGIDDAAVGQQVASASSGGSGISRWWRRRCHFSSSFLTSINGLCRRTSFWAGLAIGSTGYRHETTDVADGWWKISGRDVLFPYPCSALLASAGLALCRADERTNGSNQSMMRNSFKCPVSYPGILRSRGLQRGETGAPLEVHVKNGHRCFSAFDGLLLLCSRGRLRRFDASERHSSMFLCDTHLRRSPEKSDGSQCQRRWENFFITIPHHHTKRHRWQSKRWSTRRRY